MYNNNHYIIQVYYYDVSGPQNFGRVINEFIKVNKLEDKVVLLKTYKEVLETISKQKDVSICYSYLSLILYYYIFYQLNQYFGITYNTHSLYKIPKIFILFLYHKLVYNGIY